MTQHKLTISALFGITFAILGACSEGSSPSEPAPAPTSDPPTATAAWVQGSPTPLPPGPVQVGKSVRAQAGWVNAPADGHVWMFLIAPNGEYGGGNGYPVRKGDSGFGYFIADAPFQPGRATLRVQFRRDISQFEEEVLWTSEPLPRPADYYEIVR